MRISDWSSDVCSSDLEGDEGRARRDGCRFRPLRARTVRRGGRCARLCLSRRDYEHGGGLSSRVRGAAASAHGRERPCGAGARKSVVEGKSVSVRVDLGGRRSLKKKKIHVKFKN